MPGADSLMRSLSRRRTLGTRARSGGLRVRNRACNRASNRASNRQQQAAAGRPSELHQALCLPAQGAAAGKPRLQQRVVRGDRRAPRDADPRHRLRRVREQPRAQQVRRQ